MKTQSAGKTHVGLKRKVNEDRILLAPELGLFVLADGVGGHRAGEVASQLAVTTMRDYWQRLRAADPPAFFRQFDESLPEIARHLLNSIHFANLAVFEAQKEPDYRGMGSTIAVVIHEKDTFWAANVGDSRIYHFDSERLLQVSQDHSLAEETKLQKFFPNLEAEKYFAKNALTRALGIAETIEAFINPIRPVPGDLLLLCSDGLTNYVEESAIQLVLSDPETSLERKTQILVDEANEGGGGDNISVILVQVEKEGKWDRIKKKFQVKEG
ncbi:MAG: serine/threonine-protein phosphatase [Deltaproteobacteria bacterium]|nr:serine/threonine-protein phosphatase [Deltaproteobacteria bacterium]MBW1930309.1 serine/threonine-protein phosphatase [Deltaproteobacteria bacterium]MBW2025274.1 serine/threonine-protein phosphatase [Deltaproteobacteria bacterium]MBW2125287.1 serine/threonine-protein phosphatase [Deltaproteobacteria bacterium]